MEVWTSYFAGLLNKPTVNTRSRADTINRNPDAFPSRIDIKKKVDKR